MKQGASLESARAAKKRGSEVFALLVGEEVAVGISRLDDGSYALKVNLTSEPEPSVQFPHEVEGVPVRVEVVGKVRKQ